MSHCKLDSASSPDAGVPSAGASVDVSKASTAAKPSSRCTPSPVVAAAPSTPAAALTLLAKFALLDCAIATPTSLYPHNSVPPAALMVAAALAGSALLL